MRENAGRTRADKGRGWWFKSTHAHHLLLVGYRDCPSHAGDVGLVVFEADINALLAEWVSVQLILPTGADSSR
jgi:hypothetical protein